ncbi:hypothetical protein [Bdellovibrio sp. HCB274]
MKTTSPEQQPTADSADGSSLKKAKKFAWKIFLQAGEIGKGFLS